MARNYLAGANIGTYALFAGGSSGSSTYTNAVAAYDTALTRTLATSLNTARSNLAGASNGTYALFAGGYTGSVSSVVDAYNSALARTTATSLSVARKYLAGTRLSKYALFGGGYGSSFSAIVDTYNETLVKGTATSLSEARRVLVATTIGDYALFGGGDSSGSGSYSAVVDAYSMQGGTQVFTATATYIPYLDHYDYTSLTHSGIGLTEDTTIQESSAFTLKVRYPNKIAKTQE